MKSISIVIMFMFFSCKEKINKENSCLTFEKIIESRITDRYVGFSVYKSFRGKSCIIISKRNKRFCVVDFDKDRPEKLKIYSHPIISNFYFHDSKESDSVLLFVHSMLSDFSQKKIIYYRSNADSSTVIGTSFKSESYNYIRKNNAQYFDKSIEIIGHSEPRILDKFTNVVLIYAPKGESSNIIQRECKEHYLEKIHENWYFYRTILGEGFAESTR